MLQIARKGQAVPGGNGTISELSTDAPGMNDAGQIAFRAFIAGSSGGTADNAGIYRGDGIAATVQIARKGQAEPGGNGTITNLDGVPAINNAGQVTFQAFLGGTTGGTSDDRAIYRGDGGVLTQVVREGQPAPGGAGAGTFDGFTAPNINDAGQVAFIAFLGTGPQGVYRGGGAGGAIVEIARTGQAAPGGNGTLDSLGFFGAPPMGNGGHVVFRSILAGTTGGTSDNYAIYRGDGAAPLAQVARTGQASPDGNGTFAGLDAVALGVSDAGQTAFSATLTGTTGGNADTQGIYRGDANGQLVQIARSGQVVPDGDGTFRAMSLPAINDAGQIAFSTGFDNTTTGDGVSGGIYFYDDVLGLTKIIRSGDAFLGDKIYTVGFNSGFSRANGDGAVGLNDLGQIAFHYMLENGSSGIAIASVRSRPRCPCWRSACCRRCCVRAAAPPRRR